MLLNHHVVAECTLQGDSLAPVSLLFYDSLVICGRGLGLVRGRSSDADSN